MRLARTTIYSGIISIIRIASGFVAGKVIAILTGPSGVALIGAFTNLITVVLTFANGAINTGIVKYTAEYNKDEERLKPLFSTALKISVGCSSFVGIILLIGASLFSTWVFGEAKYLNPIRVLGLTVILYSINSMLIAILNGRGQIREYTMVNTIGSIVGLLFTVILVYFFKIFGALYALVLSQSIVCFVTIFFIFKSPWFARSYFNRAFDKSIASKLSHYSLMAIVTALTLPVAQLILRNYLASKVGIDAAGLWQGMMRISDAYLMVVTTSLSVYYLPKLSALETDAELRAEIFKGYKMIIPAVFFSCASIYVLRAFIIKVLFTDAFMEMENLFLWQLIGDFFKLAAWILSYLLLAKSMTKVYVITEILFFLCYIISGHLLVNAYSLNGIVMSFGITYFIYFLTMLVIFRKLIFAQPILKK